MAHTKKKNDLIEKIRTLKNIIMSEETFNYILTHDNPKVAAKILRNIQLLDEFGFNLTVDYIHKIRESKENLYELRTKFSNNAERTFFFSALDGKFLLTNCFREGDDGIPKNEIIKAEKILKEYLKTIK